LKYHEGVATFVCIDDVFLKHRPPGEHPERPERLVAISKALEASDLRDRVRRIAARPATDEEILRVHTDDYLHDLEKRMGPNVASPSGWIDPDTYYGAGSFEAARNAAGATIDIAKRVLAGQRDNGFALVRPPGHHASRGRAMGFCLFNNIAIAAMAARATGARVAIVDIDVHHGNGTEDVFLGDPSLLFISTHQYPFYPGTGAAIVTGDGMASGTKINVPLPQGSGGPEYRLAFAKVVLPALRRYAPDLILVSAGFDTHARDPLAGMSLVEDDYAEMVRMLLDVQPKTALVLEGGYNLEALASSVLATLRVLVEYTPKSASAPGLAPEVDLSARGLLEEAKQNIAEVQRIHHLREV
jgi:acetoin utilization deacetylase AcuC-like enzyme